jgi:hypothetical protein
MSSIQEYNENGNGVAVLNGVKVIEKEKFIVVCGGRGLGHNNSGANFLNCAKYHIEEIKSNSYPGLPKYEDGTCEIISPEELYNKLGYFINTDPPREEYQTNTEEYYIDSRRRPIGQDDNEDWYLLDPNNLENFIEPLISSSPVPIKVNDPTFNKNIPIGEIHRVSDFKKIFKIYKNIKYLCFFGHGWSGNYDGVLYIGDRPSNDTNLFLDDMRDIYKDNVLPNAQFRFFSCRGGHKVGNNYSIAELFAYYFRGCESYGWGSDSGSVFTHDKEFGYTGFNKKNINYNGANAVKIDSNKKITWLASNGKPEGWAKFKYD